MEISPDGLGVVLHAQGMAEVLVFLGLVASAIFQWILPKDKKPWTWLWNKALESVAVAVKKEYEPVLKEAYEKFDELTNKLNTIEDKVSTLEKENDKQNEIFEEHAITNSRRRIIEAADELRHGIDHSDEWYTSVLEACSQYEQYCIDHPKFPNEKAKASIALIRDRYDALLRAEYTNR